MMGLCSSNCLIFLAQLLFILCSSVTTYDYDYWQDSEAPKLVSEEDEVEILFDGSVLSEAPKITLDIVSADDDLGDVDIVIGDNGDDYIDMKTSTAIPNKDKDKNSAAETSDTKKKQTSSTRKPPQKPTVQLSKKKTPPPKIMLDASQQVRVKQLEHEAFSLGRGHPRYDSVWKQILKIHPRNSNAHVQLGMTGMTSPSYAEQVVAMEMLEFAFDEEYVDQPIPMPSRPGIILASVIGRWRWERKEYVIARKFFELAALGGDVCVSASLATMLDPFPNSTQAADDAVEIFIETAEGFLNMFRNPKLDEQMLSATVAGAASDPYVHCILTIFHLSFYYRCDIARVASLHNQVAQRVWPQLNYAPARFKTKPKRKTCTTKKIKLGIASGMMVPQSSVVQDFGGVLKRLDRNKFEITYIQFNEKNQGVDPLIYEHPEDGFVVLTKEPTDIADGAWVSRYRPKIEALDLDVLLYLDLTMSTQAQRMAMSRLAKVQANSHGHPVTSGLTSVDYYISWGLAELEPEVAAKHYTEELVLLRKEHPHQYYEPRNDGTNSLINGLNFVSHKKRSTFDTVPSNGHWYTCMQKPHKFMPEMDSLICQVLEQDPDGRVILHDLDSDLLRDSFIYRLQAAGCDMSRVHFLPVQPHHLLLALYAVSDVILDSYPAGGCTTTRECLELGKAVVTLPAKLLGGRWSYAYYQILNDQVLNHRVIATTPQEYVSKAVALGRSSELRKDAEQRILKALPKLYRNYESVKSWEQVLLQISPVEISTDGTCPDEGSSWFW